MIFDMKERLETGQKVFKSSGSREAVLRIGFTTADLKVDGKVPDDKEDMMMFVTNSRSDVG